MLLADELSSREPVQIIASVINSLSPWGPDGQINVSSWPSGSLWHLMGVLKARVPNVTNPESFVLIPWVFDRVVPKTYNFAISLSGIPG